jgi:hypothetical protein
MNEQEMRTALVELKTHVEYIRQRVDEIYSGKTPQFFEVQQHLCQHDESINRLWWAIGILFTTIAGIWAWLINVR